VDDPEKKGTHWRKLAGLYARPRVAAMLFLGFSSGLPLALILGTLSVWLFEAGLTRTAIGLFAVTGTPYALKFLWSPLVDRLPLPWLTKTFGRRRGWLLAVQAVLALSVLGLGLCDPRMDPVLTAIMALVVAFWAATQDIVIDAFRVELLAGEEQAAGAALAVFGYRLGLLASGAGALFLAEVAPWPVVYAVMASLILVGVITTLLTPEPPEHGDHSLAPAQQGRIAGWLHKAVIMPFADFMKRPGWGAILLFVMLFKFGDSLAGVMTNPFLISIGFSKVEIASVAKIFGFSATIGGLALGGMVMAATGPYRALMICGLFQCLSLLLFAAQAEMGASLSFLALTIGIENLASGMGTAVFVAYLSSLCNRAFTATQYALLSSLMAVARTWLSSGAGFLADELDWTGFFIVSAAAALPGLILLIWLRRKGLVSLKFSGHHPAAEPV
jgi:PAT family beta-lactamase induction signal transducer AmpG